MSKKAEVNKQGIFQGTMIEEGGNVRILGDDLTVGANLLKDSRSTSQDKDQYMVKSYALSENLVLNQKYTYQIKAKLSAEKQMIGIWVGGGIYCAGTSQKNSSGLYIVTFTATSDMTNKTYINVFCSNNTGTQDSTPVTGTCEIEWIKLEKGSIATPWIPNAADAAYSKLGFTSANPNINDPIKAEDFYEI